ncbi:MAG: hypothetical protein JJE25_09755 [Bacteroidia bacterium]|nr:hypothetical protein [Bacteroidia bacterium]
MTKKLLFSALFTGAALFFCFTANAQNPPVTEEVAYELPAMVSPKTITMFDDTFANMPGVKVTDYCYNLHLVIFAVDRAVQPDNTAIEQKMHSISKTDDSMMHLKPIEVFNREGYLVMCNEEDHIKR